MALTDVQVKNAKPKSAPIKLSDGDWMYLLIQPTGAKYWRFNYRFAGKQKTLALGTYPDVSLSSARKKLTAARELLASDPPIDPMKQRKEDRREEEMPMQSSGNLRNARKTRFGQPTTRRNTYLSDVR